MLCVLLSAILGALSGAAMAVAGLLGRSLYPAMIKRGYGISVFLDVDGAECCISKDGEDDVWTYLHKTEAEARTMACVLASWKDGQDGIE